MGCGSVCGGGGGTKHFFCGFTIFSGTKCSVKGHTSNVFDVHIHL